MHENRVECLIMLHFRLLILSYIFVLMHHSQKEIQLINRDKASKGFICSCYTQKQDPRLQFKAHDPHG